MATLKEENAALKEENAGLRIALVRFRQLENQNALIKKDLDELKDRADMFSRRSSFAIGRSSIVESKIKHLEDLLKKLPKGDE